MFEHLDSDGHRVSDYYETKGRFLGRDTLIPLCDGSRHFIALLAVTQFMSFDSDIPGSRTVRENLGSICQSAENLWSELCPKGSIPQSFLRSESD